MMLYETYQAQRDLTAPARALASLANYSIGELPASWTNNPIARRITAGNEMIRRAQLIHEQPPFGIDSVKIGRKTVHVHEETAVSTPFSTLTHFVKDTTHPQPKVLLVSALAGHFSTLLRSTVRSLLVDHDVYVTNWRNARDVAVEHGSFGLDDYIGQIMMFLEAIGPGTHLMAVCQPCPATLAAAAIMAEDKNPAQPKSIVLMAGPVDTRINPTKVNDLAHSKPLGWFEKNVIATVPFRYEGAGRRVYPGFLQVSAFVSMNLNNHVRKHVALYNDLVQGDLGDAQVTMDFYDEYFAVLDIAADFYLETIDRVFQRELLAQGEFTWRGRAVNPGSIRKPGLLTVEGANDDICGVGQTMAAQSLCTGIRATKKKHLLQPGVGHYGVFSGSKWSTRIYPVVRNFILAND